MRRNRNKSRRRIISRRSRSRTGTEENAKEEATHEQNQEKGQEKEETTVVYNPSTKCVKKMEIICKVSNWRLITKR